MADQGKDRRKGSGGARGARPEAGNKAAGTAGKALAFKVEDYPDFDIENPKLPERIAKDALGSGGFPYDKRMKEDRYLEELYGLQIELLKLQKSIAARKERIVIVIEGRDAAGKGGLIQAMTQHLNPRHAHTVALSRPSDVELGQWYFQRYVAHMPTAGHMCIFDRSWYNRAGVERVMGFCTPDQLADFLREAPVLEGLLVRDGVVLIKLYLSIGRATQLKRLHTRHHDPLKQWKLSPIDIEGLTKWDAYTAAQTDMFRFTHTSDAPWTVIKANDKYRARINAIRHILTRVDYVNKDAGVVGQPDPLIVGMGPGFFD